MDFNIRRGCGAKAEVQTRIVCGDKARTAEHFLYLHLPAIVHQDTCTDRAAIALCSLQTKLDPVVSRRSIVAQQRRRLVHIHDEHVDVAVVVKIAERRTPPHVDRLDAWTGLCAKLNELAVTLIAE